jgi:DNA-binding NtrC family response regulator
MDSQGTLLVVDDQQDYARGLVRLLQGNFPEASCKTAFSGQEALELLGRERVGVMLTDVRMPGMSGMDLLRRALSIEPDLSVLVITAYGSIETAVEAVKSGAYDFLTKPIDKDALFKAVSWGLERSRLLGENRRLKMSMAEDRLRKSLVGQSLAMQRLRESIEAVAESDYTVLITGESGTGKELVARTIHHMSTRADRPLMAVNCPAIPDQLLESELFGHVKGAFSGADRRRTGLFVEADGGSLLLDEIGDISMNIQTKLLRVLEEKEVRPVGSNKSTNVDVRILASTNQDLEAKITAGTFREDLFYRLQVLTVQTPPLRKRSSDIPLLASHFLHQACLEMGRSEEMRLQPETLAYLSSRSWPGNVRELQNFMRRLAVFARSDDIGMGLVRLVENAEKPAEAGIEENLPYKRAKAAVLDEFTVSYVREMLKKTGGNVSEAARLSGLERVSLQKIIKRLNIDAERYRAN